MAQAKLRPEQRAHRKSIVVKRGVVYDEPTNTIRVPRAALGNKLLGVIDHDTAEGKWHVIWNYVPESRRRINASMIQREVEKLARRSAQKGVSLTQDQILLGR